MNLPLLPIFYKSEKGLKDMYNVQYIAKCQSEMRRQLVKLFFERVLLELLKCTCQKKTH